MSGEKIICKGCGAEIDPLAVFPGGICLSCYELTPEARYVPTAEELARMWGGKA